MAVALRGNLRDFGIAEVFQLIGQQRKTGLLLISNLGSEARLAFDAGSVVWAAPAEESECEVLGRQLIRRGYLTQRVLASLYAEARPSGRSLRALIVSRGGVSEPDLAALESLITGDTIFDVLRWAEGSFDFVAQAVPHGRPPEDLLGAEQILMDGLCMVDEWRTFRELVPPLDSILEHSGNIDEYRQLTRRDRGAHADQFEKIYQLVDGRLSLQRILDLSRLGSFDATRIIAELVEAGLITPGDRKPVPLGTPDLGNDRGLAARLAGAASACIPLLLLAAMVYAIHLRGTGRPEQIAAFPIARQTLEQAHSLFEKRRVRHALEAHRYLTGDWPERLADLEASGALAGPVMAADSGPAYYYLRSENNIVLLAPER